MYLRTAILGATLVLSACESGIGAGPQSSINPERDFNAIIINNTLAPARLAALAQRSFVDANTRNAVIEARMAEIDVLYFQYERDLSAGVRRGNFVTNFAAVLIGAAGSQASGPTSQALSALGGVIAGGGAAYQKEVLLEQSVQAFLSQMRVNRNQVKQDILSNMTRPGTAYTLQGALSDLARYEQAGTLATAVSGITETAQAREVISVRALDRTEAQTSTARATVDRRPLNATDRSRAINAFISGGADRAQQTARFAQAQACFDAAAGPKPDSFTTFVANPGDSPALADAIAGCLGI